MEEGGAGERGRGRGEREGQGREGGAGERGRRGRERGGERVMYQQRIKCEDARERKECGCYKSSE